MNIKAKKEQIKQWLDKHKDAILISLGVIASVTLVIVGAGVAKNGVNNIIAETHVKLDRDEEFDPGREVEMQFIDPETKEVLGKVGCYESFMNDMIENSDDANYLS